MADQFLYVQAQPFSLAGAGAVIGDTSVILKSMTTIDGANLAMTDFGAIGFGTIEPGNGTNEEQISFSGITQNSNGTATLTGVKSVTFVSPYTQTSGLLKTHAGSTTFVISNTAGFYDKLTSKTDDETITGTWTFTDPNYPRIDTTTPGPTANAQFATKKYVDDTAIAGAPKATEAVYGITRLSTAAVSPTVPIAVGDNDTRVPTQGENDALVGTSGTPSSSNKYVTSDDVASAATVSKIARRDANGDVLVTASPSSATSATSKTYVDGQTYLTAKNGIATRTDTTASGSQTIAHGLGRTPHQTRITATWSVDAEQLQSTGVYNGTTTSMVFWYGTNSENGTVLGTAGNSSTNMVYIFRSKAGANASQVATITVDGTNITLAWTLSGTMPGNAINMLWEVC